MSVVTPSDGAGRPGMFATARPARRCRPVAVRCDRTPRSSDLVPDGGIGLQIAESG